MSELDRQMANESVTLRREIERLEKWITELQSGMYVNCVYCGHRYGPSESTPTSQAEMLTKHISICPKHPMSGLLARPRACVIGCVYRVHGPFRTFDRAQILLGRRVKQDTGFGKWVLPGGGIKGRETFEDALKRELWEECSINIGYMAQQFTYRHIDGPTNNVAVVFRAEYVDGIPEGGDDLDTPTFFELEAIPALEMTPATKELLYRLGVVPSPK